MTKDRLRSLAPLLLMAPGLSSLVCTWIFDPRQVDADSTANLLCWLLIAAYIAACLVGFRVASRRPAAYPRVFAGLTAAGTAAPVLLGAFGVRPTVPGGQTVVWAIIGLFAAATFVLAVKTIRLIGDNRRLLREIRNSQGRG